MGFHPTRNRKFQKNCKKYSKNYKTPNSFFSRQNRLPKASKERKKNYRSVPFRSYPAHKRKPQKNSKKIQKTKK